MGFPEKIEPRLLPYDRMTCIVILLVIGNFNTGDVYGARKGRITNPLDNTVLIACIWRGSVSPKAIMQSYALRFL